MTKISDNLSRLTLVIPTYNRQEFALRNMRYWSDRGPIVRVLDGSAEPISPQLLAELGDNIIYKHDSSSYYQRLLGVLPDIDTEYVALMGDDEFYIPSAVSACIDELDQNEQLVACCGRCLAFNALGGQVIGMEEYPKLAGYALLQADPVERVCVHMNDYVPSLIYAIARTSAWLIAFKGILHKEFGFFASGELQFEIALSFAGHSMVLPQLMWLRSRGETSPIRGTDPSLDESRQFSSFWHDPKTTEEREDFLQIMTTTLETLNPTPGCDYRQAVIEACENYNAFLRYSPRGYPQPLLDLPKGTPLLDAAAVLAQTGVTVDRVALNEIENIVADFSKNSVLNPPKTPYPGFDKFSTEHYVNMMPHWEDECLKKLIPSLYQQHPNAENLYARIGYYYYFLTQDDYDQAEQWFQREYDLGRMGWWMRLRHAEVYAAQGLLDKAKSLIHATYAQYPEAVNGYGMLALRLKDQITPQEALALFDQDQQLGRLTTNCAYHRALFLSRAKTPI